MMLFTIGYDIPNTFFLLFSEELIALPKMGPVFLRNCNCLGVKAGGLFIWVVFFLLFLVAAKGRRIPFCLFDVLLPVVPLHLFFSSSNHDVFL